MKWLVGLVLTAAIALLLTAFGPSYRRAGGCLFCSRTRSETWRCAVKVFNRVQETEWSAWVDGIHPTHTNHTWGTSSTMRKGWGITWAVGCGGVGAGGVAQIHILRTQLGEARDRGFLDKYHSQLKTDSGSLRQWLLTEFERILDELESTMQPAARQVTGEIETEAHNK